MKKYLAVLLAVFMSAPLFAQDATVEDVVGDAAETVKAVKAGGNSLSVGLTFSHVANAAGRGETILNDGSVDLNGDSLASATGTDLFLMPDNQNAVLVNNAESTNFVPGRYLKEFSEGPFMNNLNFEIVGMYDFTTLLELPLFARLGVNYSFTYNNCTQKRVLGEGIDQSVAASSDNFPAASDTYEGGTMEVSWHASWQIAYP